MELPPSINSASDSEMSQKSLYPITLEVEIPPPAFSKDGRKECLDSILEPLQLNFSGHQRNGEGRCSVVFRYIKQTYTEPNSPERAELENEIIKAIEHLRGCCGATFRFN